MFSFLCESSEVVNVPLEKMWVFTTDPHYRTKWGDQVDEARLEGGLRPGGVLRLKKKGKFVTPTVITEVVPFRRVLSESYIINAKAENVLLLEEVGQDQTKITIQLNIISLFSPLTKLLVGKKLKMQLADSVKRMVHFASQANLTASS